VSLILLGFQTLGIPTMSWWMAENSPTKVGLSFIEFGAETVSQDQVGDVMILKIFSPKKMEE
jgi:hypothetical protein